jgi:UDP-glucose 4-epimerase
LVRGLVARGDHVVVYDNLSRGTREALVSVASDVHIVQGDICDAASLCKALQEHHTEVVVHLAALHFIPDCDADPERCLATNVLGTQVALDCASESKTVRGFVYASTVAVYEPSVEPHRESSRLAPTDVYGSSKLAGEQLVTWFRSRTGMPTGIARISNVYGPDETNPHLIPAAIAQAQRGQVLALGDLSTRRDYVFTEDVARALLSFADLTLQSRSAVCNVGTGLTRTGEDVVSAIAYALSRELKVEIDKNRLRQLDRPVLCVDVANAASALEWRATTTFEKGIREALRSPVQHGRAFGR